MAKFIADSELSLQKLPFEYLQIFAGFSRSLETWKKVWNLKNDFPGLVWKHSEQVWKFISACQQRLGNPGVEICSIPEAQTLSMKHIVSVWKKLQASRCLLYLSSSSHRLGRTLKWGSFVLCVTAIFSATEHARDWLVASEDVFR